MSFELRLDVICSILHRSRSLPMLERGILFCIFFYLCSKKKSCLRINCLNLLRMDATLSLFFIIFSWRWSLAKRLSSRGGTISSPSLNDWLLWTKQNKVATCRLSSSSVESYALLSWASLVSSNEYSLIWQCFFLGRKFSHLLSLHPHSFSSHSNLLEANVHSDPFRSHLESETTYILVICEQLK